VSHDAIDAPAIDVLSLHDALPIFPASTFPASRGGAMEVLYPRCAGLDVHKDSVVACVRVVQGSKVERAVKTFGTTTRTLMQLVEWLSSHGVTHVAMEATGVYW